MTCSAHSPEHPLCERAASHSVSETKRLKVLILCSSFLPRIGGAQYQLKWFLDCLDLMPQLERDVEVHFAYPNQSSREFVQFDNTFTHDLRLPDLRTSSVARMIVRLGLLLRTIRPDVVHCHGVLPTAAWAVLARRMFRVKTKIIATSHGDDIARLPEWSYGRLNSARSRAVARAVTKRLSLHILISRAMTPFALQAGTPRDRIAYIPNGIPLGDEFDFEADDEPRSSTASPIAANSRGIDILCLSSGRRIKNLDTLIEAFALSRDQLGDSRLLLTCTDERIVALVKDKGLSANIEFIGEVTGALKHAYFKNSHVLCVVSHFENFPLTVLEGLKFGCAIVASRVGGIPEIIEHEHHGLLVSNREPYQIASALIRLAKDNHLRRRLVERGVQIVRRYSISGIVQEHLQVYQSLAVLGRG